METPNKDTKITLQFEGGFAVPGGKWHDLSAISDDSVNSVLDELNKNCDDGCKYSFNQVKIAMWRMLEHKIDSMLETIDEHQEEFQREHPSEWDRFIGEPEVDVREEQRLAHGDYLFDVARGN